MTVQGLMGPRQNRTEGHGKHRTGAPCTVCLGASGVLAGAWMGGWIPGSTETAVPGSKFS